MRILVVAFVVLFLYSCKKEQIVLQDQLYGKWKWEKSTGGIAGVTNLPVPGEWRTLEFFTSGKYEMKKNDSLEREGNFHIEKMASQYSTDHEYAVVYENGPIPQIIRVLGSDLILLDNANDGFACFYVRIK
jgi:hypothetical protein